MSVDKLRAMRRDYENVSLDIEAAPTEPFSLFNQWLKAAAANDKIVEPNAMHLATVDKQGMPSARMVLLKDLIKEQFIFYTNYQSRKALQLAANPYACLTFWWEALARQVRIEGKVKPLAAEISDGYFAERDRASQLGAWASPQSSELKNYDELLERFTRIKEKFSDHQIPRPPHWGGYCLAPHQIEFWQGQKSRLHKRILYSYRNNEWKKKCLAP